MSGNEYELSRIEAHISVLKVHMNCQGCMNKVRKALRKIEGVYEVDINAEEQRVTVLGVVNTSTLVQKLAKLGKHAEILSINYNQDQFNIDENNKNNEEYMIPTLFGKDDWGYQYFNQDLSAQTMEFEINQQLTAPTPLFFTNFNDGNNQNFTMNCEYPKLQPTIFQENNGTNYLGVGMQEWEHNLPQESSINEYNHQPSSPLISNIHRHYHDSRPSEIMYVFSYNHAPLEINTHMQETSNVMMMNAHMYQHMASPNYFSFPFNFYSY